MAIHKKTILSNRKGLTQEELERTKRQKLIEGWNQEIIKNSTVFIAGVGALGCEIAKDLALLGIGKLILCDMDKIETSNLSRQMLFYKGDEGRYKAEVAAERLKLMNPYMETEVYTTFLQKISMEKYMECQVIIAALDNVQARIDLNKFCLKLGIPLVEGGTVGFEGHVHVIIPEATKTQEGQPFPFGNVNKIKENIFQEKLWTLDENDYIDYFKAQEEIRELENRIHDISINRLLPIHNKLKEEANEELEANKEKYMNHTPCYRCVVPIPPPLQNQVAACTLKGIPRTREHCAIRGEVVFIKKYEKKPDYDDINDMIEVKEYAQQELQGLRDRVLEESIPPEMKNSVTEEEKNTIRTNIIETFGTDFAIEDMENILGNKIPAIQSVSSIISSIETQETIKLLFLSAGSNVGPIMDPPYINYNGIYGQFDQVEISRREDCVACGSGQGQENLAVAVPNDSTINDLFVALRQVNNIIDKENWIITNPISKKFIYNPMFEKGKTEDELLSKFELKNMDEVTLTALGKMKDTSEIKQFNVILQII